MQASHQESSPVIAMLDELHSQDSRQAVIHSSDISDHDFGSEPTWNEEEHKSELESYGLSLHDSLVVALREEATKFDAVMAVDQVKSLKECIQRLKRDLCDRTLQVDELRALLELKDDRIGTLELERDLFKADRAKLTTDLEESLKKVASLETETTVSMEVSEKSEPHDEPPSLTCSSSGQESNQSSLTSTTASQSVSSKDQDQDPPFPVIEKPRMVRRVKSNNRVQAFRDKARKFPFCRNGKVLGRRKLEGDEESTPGYTDPGEEDEILQSQIQEMTGRLKNALSTADELRRRLAIVSRYYENAIGQLETDMTDRLNLMAVEKRNTIALLESKLREEQLRSKTCA